MAQIDPKLLEGLESEQQKRKSMAFTKDFDNFITGGFNKLPEIKKNSEPNSI